MNEMQKPIAITSKAYERLRETVGKLPPETGALIGEVSSIITQVWFDERAGSGQEYYKPSFAEAEEVVCGWQEKGIHFAGVVHSHIADYPTLSPMDLRSALAIMHENHMPSILLGLYCESSLSFYQVFARYDHLKPCVILRDYQILYCL